MEQEIAQQIESIHLMLTKTREEMKGLKFAVYNLNMAVAGNVETHPPTEELHLPPSNDDQEMLQTKNIEVGSKELMEILQISYTTLKRWRSGCALPCTYITACHVTYNLGTVYKGIKSGVLKCKGLNKITAIERILNYANNIRQLRAEIAH